MMWSAVVCEGIVPLASSDAHSVFACMQIVSPTGAVILPSLFPLLKHIPFVKKWVQHVLSSVCFTLTRPAQEQESIRHFEWASGLHYVRDSFNVTSVNGLYACLVFLTSVGLLSRICFCTFLFSLAASLWIAALISLHSVRTRP